MLGLWSLCFGFDWWFNLNVIELIVVGIWLFGWFWEIELKDDDFELWFCLNGEFMLEIRKAQWVFCWNSGLEVEDDENSIWSSNLTKITIWP